MNKIETIKIGDIEVPVEHLRQTTVNVNGDDYIRLQQENKQLKNNWNKLKEWTKKAVDKYYDCDLRVDMVYKNVLDRMQELEKSDSNEQMYRNTKHSII